MEKSTNSYEKLKFDNPIAEITKKWKDEGILTYPSDEELSKLNEEIALDMEKFNIDFLFRNHISQIEAKKLIINT
jgi:hypothetical protein